MIHVPFVLMVPKYVYVIYNLTVLTSLVLVGFAILTIFAAMLICILSANDILAMPVNC